jgi:hypothetical protein
MKVLHEVNVYSVHWTAVLSKMQTFRPGLTCPTRQTNFHDKIRLPSFPPSPYNNLTFVRCRITLRHDSDRWDRLGILEMPMFNGLGSVEGKP